MNNHPLSPILVAFLLLYTITHQSAVAQRPLSSANASMSANAIPSFATFITSSPPTVTTIRPMLRRVVNYAGNDGQNLGSNGHLSRPNGTPRKMSGGKSSSNAIETMSQISTGAQHIDAADHPAYTAQQQGRIVPPRFPPGSAVMALNVDKVHRKYGISDLRRNMSQAKVNWERQGEEPEYALPVQGSPKDPIRVLKEVFNNNHITIPQPEMAQRMEDVLGVQCNFETACAWTWNEDVVDGFQTVTGANLTASNRTGMMPGPAADVNNDANGHFLHVRLTPSTGSRVIQSPIFGVTQEKCDLFVAIHMSGMLHGAIRLIIVPQDSLESSWVPIEIDGNNQNSWHYYSFKIGRVSQYFHALLEVSPRGLGGHTRGHVSIDDLKLRSCFKDPNQSEACETAQVKCHKNKRDLCLRTVRVCDIDVDCDGREDERLNCDKIPFGGRCDFEKDWCGWRNSGKALMLWNRHSGPTPTDKTGPDADHTFQYHNDSGHYLYVNMNQHAADAEMFAHGFASNAVMNSVVFNRPPAVNFNVSSPYRHSCMVRFNVHQYGPNAGSVNMSVVEIGERENITTTLWWSSRNLGPEWQRENIVLPNITSKYMLQFEARQGMRIYSDVAIDDISLSPECFGLNIPIDALGGYNYYDVQHSSKKPAHEDFVNQTNFHLSTCGARGKDGPRTDQCISAYNRTEMAKTVRTIVEKPYRGVQVWKVPRENYYTIIAKGAGGGLGSGGVGSSRGAMAISVLELHLDEEIHFLIGQKGEHACIKSMGYREKECEPLLDGYASDNTGESKTKQVKNLVIEDGAGGGGGATFVFVLNPSKVAVPLMVAAGGGGLGIGRYLDEHDQHGRLYQSSENKFSGKTSGDTNITGGPGGGWQTPNGRVNSAHSGMSLLEGGRGGDPCYLPRGIHGQGGFGGGGGGCNTGGGGGGYSGGNTNAELTNGDGGTSFISSTRSVPTLSTLIGGENSGSGSISIVPALPTPACGCDYRCVALDEFSSQVACICPDNWRLKKDNLTACERILESVVHEETYSLNFLIVFFASVSVALFTALGILISILYNRYQRNRQAAAQSKSFLNNDLQLARLRNNPDDVNGLNHFNPNYGCDGILSGRVDVKTLPQVAREKLNLVKPLGQGAFGEVYQGLYRHRDGDAVEMPVAVKTLPDLSTGQAEDDFLMEASIMAKFSHPNIVHLIGVCFDRHPRYIVLELLAGGDLKNFLREGRNRPDYPSVLSMKDLMFCAMDVAKGCRYLESKRFIHRDIAARNCLLSSKGPGRVVKIADFGMARDIYRSDYYRKGGKAMLPIKWMPPEAFLDGIFTSKTDVWSFGILMWEVFSQGIMPYTSRNNNQVMKFVATGGRCECPDGCSPEVYRLMRECWNLTPESRPTFSYLLDQLSSLAQEPDLMNAPLAIFIRPPSAERDLTVMRPPIGDEEMCLTAPNSSDYLIPLPLTSVANANQSYQQNPSPQSVFAHNGQISDGSYQPNRQTSPSGPVHHIHNDSGCWETSFTSPNSQSSAMDHHALEEHKLILLDTPQQTPTTIKPPTAFGDRDTSSNSIATITLDPAHLSTAVSSPVSVTSYANVHMQLPQEVPPPPSQERIDRLNAANRNGGIPGGDKMSSNVGPPPFTIQGFNDRYKPGENHSEISC